MNNNVYVPPPNTKAAVGHEGQYTIWVECPHCGKIHHHELDAFIFVWTAVEAPCELGHYTINIETGPE